MKNEIEISSLNSQNNISLIQRPEKPPQITNEEKWGILLLHVLYFVQGLPIGFFSVALIFLLTEAGATFSEIGILSFSLYPFSLKILFAPIEDMYFMKKFGKRKSYVVPCQYVLGAGFFFLGFEIDNLIIDKNVYFLTLIGFLMVSSAAIQDIAVDGWNLTLLRNKNLGWGVVSQSVGQSIGILFGGNVLIQLSSKNFCNDYLYSEPSETPLLTINTFFRIFGLLIIFINIYVHLKCKERNPVIRKKRPRLLDLIKELKGFYYNKNLRFYVIFLLTWKIGFASIVNTAELNLIKQGFPKETIITISTFLIPLNFIFSFLIGKYVRIGQEMTFFLCFWLISFFNNIFFYILVIFYSHIPKALFTFLFAIACLVGEGISNAISVTQGGFTSRISDEDVGGTYLTFLNSMSNFGTLGAGSLAFFMVDSFDYNLVVFCSWLFLVIYFLGLKKKILNMEKIKKREWNL